MLDNLLLGKGENLKKKTPIVLEYICQNLK